MKAIHIRNVPPQTLRALKRLAQTHRRSLQGELHCILEQAARLAPEVDEPDELELVTVETQNQSSWSRDEVYDDRGR